MRAGHPDVRRHVDGEDGVVQLQRGVDRSERAALLRRLERQPSLGHGRQAPNHPHAPDVKAPYDDPARASFRPRTVVDSGRCPESASSYAHRDLSRHLPLHLASYGDVGLDGNSIAILSRDGVLVFDTNGTPAASRGAGGDPQAHNQPVASRQLALALGPWLRHRGLSARVSRFHRRAREDARDDGGAGDRVQSPRARIASCLATSRSLDGARRDAAGSFSPRSTSAVLPRAEEERAASVADRHLHGSP